MNWEEFENIIDSTTIELYNSEWQELKEAFEKWRESCHTDKSQMI